MAHTRGEKVSRATEAKLLFEVHLYIGNSWAVFIKKIKKFNNIKTKVILLLFYITGDSVAAWYYYAQILFLLSVSLSSLIVYNNVSKQKQRSWTYTHNPLDALQLRCVAVTAAFNRHFNQWQIFHRLWLSCGSQRALISQSSLEEFLKVNLKRKDRTE